MIRCFFIVRCVFSVKFIRCRQHCQPGVP
jgi:hypothetical protein